MLKHPPDPSIKGPQSPSPVVDSAANYANEPAAQSGAQSGAQSAPEPSTESSVRHAANIVMAEAPEQFEARKADHIRLSLDPKTQTTGLSGLDQIELEHEAFPELNFAELDFATELFGKLTKPIFISSMTAGHAGSMDLNRTMARVAEKRNWIMGVGSQRRQLTDKQSDQEWKEIRKACPRVRFFGNIGLAQLILTPSHEVRRLADSLEADSVRALALRRDLLNELDRRHVRYAAVADNAHRLPGSLLLKFHNTLADDLVQKLANTVALSTGSACNKGQIVQSHVLYAMGLSTEESAQIVRIYCGRYNTPAEIRAAGARIALAVADLALATGGVRQ